MRQVGAASRVVRLARGHGVAQFLRKHTRPAELPATDGGTGRIGVGNEPARSPRLPVRSCADGTGIWPVSTPCVERVPW